MHLPTDFCCLQSVHFMQALLQNVLGDCIWEVAKEKDLINFLFNMMPYLLKDEVKSLA